MWFANYQYCICLQYGIFVLASGWVRCIHSLWMWRCCLLPCTQLKDLIHPDESPMYTLYCYRFSCRSVQQCFWESIAKLVDGFWILTTLFAAFRNCRSVRSNFTAQAHLCFPLSDDPVNRETSQGKPGKYHTWVGRQKCDGQKSPNQFSSGLRKRYQKRAADNSKPTGAHTNDIHKNRHISLYKNCTSRLHSDELRGVNIHISAAANHLWTIAIR